MSRQVASIRLVFAPPSRLSPFDRRSAVIFISVNLGRKSVPLLRSFRVALSSCAEAYQS